MFANLRREIPAPSLSIFISLQVLDVLTTMIGIRMGAAEASVFIGRMMHLGALPGLLIAKIFAVFLAMAALKFKRERLLVFLNYWFAMIVGWNLCTILYTGVSRH